MSKTDIIPPRDFNSPGSRTYTLQGYDSYFDRWFPASTYTEPNLSLFGTEMRRGQTTPGFLEKQRTGNLPQNSFSYSKLEGRYFNGVYEYEIEKSVRYKSQGVHAANFMSIPAHPGPISAQRRFNLDTKVKQKLLERIKDSSVNAAVAIAEGKQTISMIANAIQRLAKAHNAARRGNFRAAAAALGVKPRFGGYGPGSQSDAVARGWLELQYGWMPLLSDIYGTIEHIQKMYSKTEYVTVKYGSSIQEDSQVTDFVGDEFVDITSVKLKYQSNGIVKLRRTDSSGVRTAVELGFTNPALVAWEKVPFSFLVDYLVPVGTYLSQFDSTIGWSFVDGSLTNFSQLTAKKERFSSGNKKYSKHHVSGFTLLTETTCLRTPLAGFGLLFTALPYVKDTTSVTKILNVLALLKTSKR